MDKKYLDALSNFAYALEELVEEMKKQSDAKKSSKSGALSGGKSSEINKTLENINNGISEIKDNTKEILSNQKTLLKMGKDGKKSGGLLSGLTDDKKKGEMKKGIGTVILMAGAILAIGLAFKVVGGVDFLSVMALSFALPLMAVAFTEVAVAITENKIGVKEMFFTAFALVLMAGAITVSSWIMSAIAPIGPWQFLTGIGIALTLAIASIGVSFLLKNLGKVDMGDLLKLPIVLVAISTAIMLSSYILGATQEIAPGLLLNIVLQGLALGIVSMAMIIPIMLLKKSSLNPKDIFLGGLFTVVIAGAIMVSSHLLAMGNYNNAPSIGWSIQAGIALLAFSIPVLALGIIAMTGIGIAAVALGGLMTILVSAAIVATSHILAEGNYENGPGLAWATTTTLLLVVFSGLMMSFGFSFISLFLGGLMTLAVAGTIVATSYILAEGDYENGPGLGWTTETVLVLAEFGALMGILGLIAMTGIGFIAVALAVPMALMIAGTIVSVSQTLSEGDYSSGGDMAKWALATSSLYLLFTPMMIALGAMGLVSSVISFFGGPDPFELAKGMMVQIASTIVDISNVLADGNWADGPTEDWARGLSLAIGAFAPVFSYLQRSGIYEAFFGAEAMSGEEYATTMRSIGYAIIDVANVFAEGRVDKWVNGPKKEWAEGVGLAIGAFAPIFKIISEQGLLDSILGGDTAGKMGSAITVVSRAIMDSANIFADDTGVYKGGPKKEWAEGVGKSIESFSKLYEWAADWDGDDIESGNAVIYKIARSILHMAKIMGGYEMTGSMIKGDLKFAPGPKPMWDRFPETKWTSGVIKALKGFAELYGWVYDGADWEEDDITDANKVIFSIARSILEVAGIMAPLGEMTLPSANAAADIGKNLKSWKGVIESASDLDVGGLFTVTTRLFLLASGFNALADSLNNLGGAINGFSPEFVSVLAEVSGVDIEIKDKEYQSEGSKAAWWDSLLGAKDETTSKPPVSEVRTATKKEDSMGFKELHDKLEEMNQKLEVIASSSTNMSQYVDELRSGSNQGVQIGM